ncbi:MAG: acetyltransferase [Frankiales bacterium]|jgi:ribosomal protein S18 acetylase RimI-like enzyme|nr:acetyltransferase [Frankiales bacterium]
MTVAVRRVGPDDWRLVRALRLEALGDTQIAYLETLAEAQQLDDVAWQARATRGAPGGDSHQVLALQAGRPVGTAVSFVDDRAAWLAAVYLAPAVRGPGC